MPPSRLQKWLLHHFINPCNRLDAQTKKGRLGCLPQFDHFNAIVVNITNNFLHQKQANFKTRNYFLQRQTYTENSTNHNHWWRAGTSSIALSCWRTGSAENLFFTSDEIVMSGPPLQMWGNWVDWIKSLIWLVNYFSAGSWCLDLCWCCIENQWLTGVTVRVTGQVLCPTFFGSFLNVGQILRLVCVLNSSLND